MASEHKEQERITDRCADGSATAAGVFIGITYLLINPPEKKNCWQR